MRTQVLPLRSGSFFTSASFGAALGIAAFFMLSMPVHAETIQVTIKDMAFSPAQITVKAGDTVEWINEDILKHTATVDGGWDVIIPAKKSVSMVVKQAGDYDYYCRFHPNMRGKITAK